VHRRRVQGASYQGPRPAACGKRISLCGSRSSSSRPAKFIQARGRGEALAPAQEGALSSRLAKGRPTRLVGRVNDDKVRPARSNRQSSPTPPCTRTAWRAFATRCLQEIHSCVRPRLGLTTIHSYSERPEPPRPAPQGTCAGPGGAPFRSLLRLPRTARLRLWSSDHLELKGRLDGIAMRCPDAESSRVVDLAVNRRQERTTAEEATPRSRACCGRPKGIPGGVGRAAGVD